MKAIVLGCGGSGGVPLIGNVWGACNSKNRKNRRTRVSILIKTKKTSILVDCSPDMRQQLLKARVKKIDAVLITPAHADHVHGIDDFRSLNRVMKRDIDLYADKNTLKILKKRFDYVFKPLVPRAKGFFYKPCLQAHETREKFRVGDIDIVPFIQKHGYSESLGYRFGPLAYSTDVSDFSVKSLSKLRGIKIWIVDCLRLKPHPSHSHLKKTLSWIRKIKPEKAILTHLNHEVDYDELSKMLPPGVEVGFDGMRITF